MVCFYKEGRHPNTGTVLPPPCDKGNKCEITRARRIIWCRVTTALRRPIIKQYSASNEGTFKQKTNHLYLSESMHFYVCVRLTFHQLIFFRRSFLLSVDILKRYTNSMLCNRSAVSADTHLLLRLCTDNIHWYSISKSDIQKSCICIIKGRGSFFLLIPWFYNSLIYFILPGKLTKEQQLKLENIKQKLTVHKKNTKAAKMKKISAPDSRPTAKAVGAALGIGLLVLVLSIIVLPDIPIIIHDIREGPRRVHR